MIVLNDVTDIQRLENVRRDFVANVSHELKTPITAIRGWDNREIREGDWLDRPAAYVGNAFAQLHDDGPQESKTFSQELRIASPTGKMLEYVAGLYYYRADADRVFTRSDVVCTASTLAIDATGQRPCATGQSTFTTPSSTARVQRAARVPRHCGRCSTSARR